MKRISKIEPRLVRAAACAAFLLVAAALSLTSRAWSADPAHKPGEIVIEPATLELSATEKIDYELGTLYVPQNRSDPHSRIIGVGFARFKATMPTGAPPTFHLPGGPGGSFISGLRGMARFLLRFRDVGDVVVVDQRGFSQRGDVMRFGYRTLEQPLDQPAGLDRATAAWLQVSRDAVASFEKRGFDLRGYTVKECAEDVNDLRKALGYGSISLVGTSFGSQWSFAVMRLHPEVVARALLSGVEPLDFGYDSPSGVLSAIQRMWKEAEKDKSLQHYIPPGGIDAAAKEVLNRLEHAPVTVQVKDKKTGETTSVTLGKEDFQRDFRQKLAESPAWILSLYYERYDAWAASVLAKRRSHSDQVRMIGPLIDTSLGVTPERERQLNHDPAIAFLGRWNWTAYVASKDIWPTADAGDDFRRAVETPIPVVFAQGNWDTSTPVENTLTIVKSFPNSRIIIVERGGHGVLEPIAGGHPKVWAELMGFLRTGDMPALPERVAVSAPKFVVPDSPPRTRSNAGRRRFPRRRLLMHYPTIGA